MLKEGIYFCANLEDTQMQKEIEALSSQKPHFSLKQEFKNENVIFYIFFYICIDISYNKVLQDWP